MRLIVNPNTIIFSFLGNQKVVCDSEYVKPFFCHVIKSEGKYLVFNSLNKALVELDDYEENIIFNDNSLGTEKFLIENYFYVSKEFDQFAICTQIKTLMQNFKTNSKISKFDIFPTTDCNARCFYCFEHGSKRYSMTDSTAKDVAEYIYNKSDKSKVTINWFGGEPLYNMNAIDIICKYLKERNVDFHSTMITNGYLLDADVVEKAKNLWKLDSLQISLDGTEEVYNKTKAYIYKNDPSPFKRVINNIKILLNASIKVHIRLNVSAQNIEDLFKLVDVICEEIGSNKRINVYTWLLYDNRGVSAKTKTVDERHFLLDSMNRLNEYISSKGLSKSSSLDDKFRTVSCMADDDTHITILPNGNIGKCDHHLDDEYIGSIYKNDFDKSKIAEWKVQRKSIPLCRTCPLFMECRILDKCPDAISKQCDVFEQKLRFCTLEKQMIHTYKKFKLEKGND